MTNKVAKLQRACLIDPVKVEVAQKYSTVDTLRQQYLFIPAKYKVAGLLFVVPKPSCFAVPPYPVTISMLVWIFCLHLGSAPCMLMHQHLDVELGIQVIFVA